jgi:hypothetical protein
MASEPRFKEHFRGVRVEMAGIQGLPGRGLEPSSEGLNGVVWAVEDLPDE